MDRYVVIGNPVSHSLSPFIHARFAEQTGIRMHYETLLAPRDAFALHARAFFAGGGRGANVTLPFKVEAFALARFVSERARAAGAANFLAQHEDGLHADNTDGAGLVRDLMSNLGVRLRDARILIVGAGGAARGVMAPLLANGPREIVIANRTLARARELEQRFASTGAVRASGLESIPESRYDLVVNATSTSIEGETLDLPGHILAGALAYDMAYGPGAHAFLGKARAHAARVSDGLGMLVEQAAESFELWRGVRPDTASVLAELRERDPC
jgi:shikimate dehydrogenase